MTNEDLRQWLLSKLAKQIEDLRQHVEEYVFAVKHDSLAECEHYRNLVERKMNSIEHTQSLIEEL